MDVSSGDGQCWSLRAPGGGEGEERLSAALRLRKAGPVETGDVAGRELTRS